MGFEPFVGGEIKNPYPLMTWMAKDTGGPTEFVKTIYDIGVEDGINKGNIKGAIMGVVGTAAVAGSIYIINKNKKGIKKFINTQKSNVKECVVGEQDGLIQITNNVNMMG